MQPSLIKSIAAVVIAYINYILASLFQVSLWSDLAAPVFDCFAAGLIFHAIYTSKNREFRLNYILAACAIVSWGIADILWMIDEQLLLVDPDGDAFITFFYFGTNLFLVAATLFYVYYRLRRWDSVQLVLDGVVFSVAILWSLWILLYGKDMNQLERLMDNVVINALTIVMDAFLIVVIGIWYLSIRKGSLPLFLRVLVGSVFLYAATDLVYYHLYANGLYVPDTIIDICYYATLLGIAVSIKAYYVKYPTAYHNPSQNTNVGHMHKGLILIVLPVLVVVLRKIDVLDIVIFAGLILFHEYASGYIQSAIKNKTLLQYEQDMTQKLERQVSERTRELEATNETLRQRNEDLLYINDHDPLTSLYNRRYFMDKLDETISGAAPGEKVALILWNVDNLKGINDTYGHQTGDQILIFHAEHVRKALKNRGLLARLSGDEFAFAVRGAFMEGEPCTIAKEIVDACKEPIHIGGYTFHITIGAGVTMYPVCASDRSGLLRNADIAMQYAKQTRPDSHIAKYADIDKAMERKYLIGAHLKDINYSKDLHLHFQPQFRASDRRLIGMEALLRWDCSGLGSVSPAEFIPIAESENLIIPIGNWVIEQAVRQIARWNNAYHSDLQMGINISPKQVGQESTLQALDASIRRHHAQPGWIDIEITEGVALDSEDSAAHMKAYFKNKGITISIDDFGTGYSSLGYLSILSFDRLKIAKPLIDRITSEESNRKIVTSIILLAKSLGLRTIAEGVETQAQFDLLLKLGCDQIQGYYLGRPTPADEFENNFLKQIDSQRPSRKLEAE